MRTHPAIDATLTLGSRWNRRPDDRLIGPMPLVFGALSDPPLKQRLLLGLERLMGLRGRHQLVGVIGQQPMHQFAAGRIARQDCLLARLGRPERRLADIQTQAALHLLHIGAVAGKAVVGEDRPDVPIELDRSRCRRRSGGCRSSHRTATQCSGDDPSGQRPESASVHGVS